MIETTQTSATVADELEPALLSALRRTESATAAIFSGDPEPIIACWADSADATLFGAWEPVQRGTPAVIDTFRWVASRCQGDGQAAVENTVIASSGDLAYTVGFERASVRVDGGREQQAVIRVTHIYRRADGAWKLIHRHADHPPADPRQQ